MALDDTTSIDELVDAAFEADGTPTPDATAEQNPFAQNADNQTTQKKALDNMMSDAGGNYADGAINTPHSQAAKDKKEKEAAKRRVADAVMASLSEPLQIKVDEAADGFFNFLKSKHGLSAEDIIVMSDTQLIEHLEKDPEARAKRDSMAAEHAQNSGKSFDQAKVEINASLAESTRLIAEAELNRTRNMSHFVATGIAGQQASTDAPPPSDKNSLEAFSEQLKLQIQENKDFGEDLKATKENLEAQVSFLTGPHAPNDPDIQVAIIKAQEEIEKLENSLQQTNNMNDFYNQLGRFTQENASKLEAIKDPSEAIEMALDDKELMKAYIQVTKDFDPETRQATFMEVAAGLGVPPEAAQQAYENMMFAESHGQNFMNDVWDTASDIYEWGASWFEQPVESTASQSDEVITQQQEKIDALTEQKDAFMKNINAMDNPGGLMNYYFGKVEELDAKINEMQTQLDDYKTAIAKLEAAEQSLASIDEQLEKTTETIDDLYKGGMSTAPDLANGELSLTERFSDPTLIAANGQFSTPADAPNMSKIDPTTLKIRSAEFQANILEIEQADAAAALAKAAAIKDRAESEITGEDADTTSPAPAPDPAQLALDSNIEKINGLFSSGMTMPEEDFIAWAKENGIAIPEGQENRFTDMVIEKLADNGISRINPIAPRIDTPDAPNSTLSASRAGPPSNPGLFNAAADPAQSTPDTEVALDFTPKQDPTITMGANG